MKCSTLCMAIFLSIALMISSGPAFAAKGGKVDRQIFCMGGAALVESTAALRDKGVEKSAVMNLLSKNAGLDTTRQLVHLQAISAAEFAYSLPGISPHDLSLISLGSCLAHTEPEAAQKRKNLPYHAPRWE